MSPNQLLRSHPLPPLDYSPQSRKTEIQIIIMASTLQILNRMSKAKRSRKLLKKITSDSDNNPDLPKFNKKNFHIILALYKEQLLRQQATNKAAKANFKPEPKAFLKLSNFPLKNVPVGPKLSVTLQTYILSYY